MMDDVVVKECKHICRERSSKTIQNKHAVSLFEQQSKKKHVGEAIIKLRIVHGTDLPNLLVSSHQNISCVDLCKLYKDPIHTFHAFPNCVAIPIN